MAARYYYRFDTSTALGKKFRSFWNECNKAERAAEVFAKKVGAAAYYSSPSAFAGGVACVAFEPGKVNEKIWRSAGRSDEGEELYEPNVEQRHGVLVLPRRGFRPSDTATRIYSKRMSTWKEVQRMLTLSQWAEKAGVTMPTIMKLPLAAKLTDEEKKAALEQVEQQVNRKMERETFVQYIELYRDEEIPVDPYHPKRKTPLFISQSIRIERERMLLPIVRTEALHALLQADLSGDEPKDNKPKVVHNVTPTFFEWCGRYYVGIEYPCKAEELTAVTEGAYRMALTNLRQTEAAQRELEGDH